MKFNFNEISADIISNFEKPASQFQIIDELKKMNDSLERDIELATRQAEDAKRESAFSKRMAYISLIISIISALGALLPYIL